MAKKPGSLWVEGEELHYVAANGAEWYIKGEYWGGGIGKPGALWIGNDAYIYYLSAAGQRFRIPLQNMHSDAAAQKACIWVEGNYLFHSIGGAKFWEHGDYVHSDGTTGHTDVPHADGHLDSTHGDSHGDGHTDSGHVDSHTDAAHGDGVTNHSDGHYDYNGTGPAGPGNHADGGVYWDRPDGHVDNHYDAYNEYGWSSGHTDTHYDSGDHSDGTHGDSHGDASHGDSHNDVAHVDGSHGDGHSDSAHQDAAHADGAGSHQDIPAYIGP